MKLSHSATHISKRSRLVAAWYPNSKEWFGAIMENDATISTCILLSVFWVVKRQNPLKWWENESWIWDCMSAVSASVWMEWEVSRWLYFCKRISLTMLGKFRSDTKDEWNCWNHRVVGMSEFKSCPRGYLLRIMTLYSPWCYTVYGSF